MSEIHWINNNKLNLEIENDDYLSSLNWFRMIINNDLPNQKNLLFA